MRWSTRGSCSSESGSNVVITQRERRLRTPIRTLPGTQAVAGPVGLLEPLRARDHDVRAEAAAVDADLLDHRLRHDRERQHVVALPVVHARRADQLDARPGGCPHELARRGGRPRQTVDRRLAVLVERPLQPEQPRTEARRDDASRLLPHMHEAVAGDAVLVDVRSREALAPERLDRIPPQLRHAHLHGRRLLRGDVSGAGADLIRPPV